MRSKLVYRDMSKQKTDLRPGLRQLSALETLRYILYVLSYNADNYVTLL